MPLDFEKLKQGLLNRGTKVGAANPNVQQASTRKESVLTSNPKVSAFKQGLADIKAVGEDGNYKLFVKQFIVVLLGFLAVRFLSGELNAQKTKINDEIAAISAQQTNEEDYLANKERLLRLEPLFPDQSQKNEWLLKALMDVFAAHQIKADINGNANEQAEPSYTAVSQDVSFQGEFNKLGEFLADVENGDDFLRISQLTINKINDPAMLGQNKIDVRFSTLFPKEKYAKRLFKDYDKQMAKIKGTAPAAKEGKNAK